MKQILSLDPATYERHLIHGANRTWAETNCYTDVVIELLHGLGHEPMAALPFTLAIDFEGDQWTFFKFPQVDLLELYGFDIHELAPWRPLTEHIEEQVGAGRPVLVELDSHYLPDTAGTAYKLAHVKSTVAVNAIDIAGRRLGYFHNQGYHVLDGQDFSDVFQMDGLAHERMLPPYIEFVKKVPHVQPLSGKALVEASVGLVRRHLGRIPERNPFPAFKAKFQTDLDWLLQSDLEVFHAYSFATLRQYGACFELAGTCLSWLSSQGVQHLGLALEAFDQISQATKAFQFQLARSMARKKAFDLSPLDGMAEQWARAMDSLQHHFGGSR
ncbi:MAG TPA: DUF1839 family protein [Holophagaceae bacterium]|jgi:hypothetical protein|nr:DUF1839 family protein [Holophagaceae bacterium]